MTGEETKPGCSSSSLDSKVFSRRLRKIIIATVLGVVVVSVDLAVLRWVVPWAHEHYLTVYGSGGYVVVYFTVLLTVMASLALMTYVFRVIPIHQTDGSSWRGH